MPRFRIWSLVVLIGLAAALSGCASTGLVNRWSRPGFDTPMRSMLVVAMKKNDGNRRIMEDAFVAELGKYGVTATASYTVFPGAMPDTESVREYVRTNQLNGVLVAARLPAREVTETTPGYSSREVRTRYNNWTGRYHTYYVEVDHEPTTTTQRVIPHRVDVWYADGKGGELVWTAEGQSVDPASSAQVSKEMCNVVAADLAKRGLIPAKR